MDNKDAIQDLESIRTMMERSSRFQTINGWGVTLVGLIALAAAAVANGLFYEGTDSWFSTIYGNTDYLWSHKTRIAIFGAVILVIVCGAIVFFTSLWTAKKKNISVALDPNMRRTLFNFAVPLLAGAILCLALLAQEHYGLTSSIMLIFYGLALINCHHFSHRLLGTLGYLELALGMADCFVETHALLFWALGFGALHVVFGILLIVKKRRG